MKIEILGTGCHNCLSLEMMVARLVQELNIAAAELTRVDDAHQIRRMMPEDELPGLALNGRLVCWGRLPAEAEVREWLYEAAQLEQARQKPS